MTPNESWLSCTYVYNISPTFLQFEYFMIQDGIIGELSLTKPFIGCYLGSEFSELNRPSLDNESRNLLILTKMTESRDR